MLPTDTSKSERANANLPKESRKAAAAAAESNV